MMCFKMQGKCVDFNQILAIFYVGCCLYVILVLYVFWKPQTLIRRWINCHCVVLLLWPKLFSLINIDIYLFMQVSWFRIILSIGHDVNLTFPLSVSLVCTSCFKFLIWEWMLNSRKSHVVTYFLNSRFALQSRGN